MNHQSAGQYLYTLYAILFAFVLEPLTFITLLHYLKPEPPLIGNVFMKWFFATIAIALVILIEYVYRTRLKNYHTIVSLLEKLSKYFRLTIVRFAGLSFSLNLLAVGYLLLQDSRLTYLFVLILLYAALHWPASSVICKDLKLSRNECEAFQNWK